MRTGEAEQSHGGRTGSGQAWEVSHPCELAPGRGKKGDLWPWAWHPQRSQSAQDHGLFGQRQKVACGWSRECLVRNWQGMKMKRLSSGQIWLLLPGKKGAELCPVNDRRVLSTTHKVAQPWRLGAHTHTNTHPTQTRTHTHIHTHSWPMRVHTHTLLAPCVRAHTHTQSPSPMHKHTPYTHTYTHIHSES